MGALLIVAVGAATFWLLTTFAGGARPDTAGMAPRQSEVTQSSEQSAPTGAAQPSEHAAAPSTAAVAAQRTEAATGGSVGADVQASSSANAPVTLPIAAPAPGPGVLQPYLADIAPTMVSVGTSTQRMSDLASRVAGEPGLVLDAGWKGEMTAALAEMKAVGAQLRAQRAVPLEARDLNDTLAALGADLVYVADEMQGGLEAMNPTRLRNALARTGDMNARIPVLASQVERLTGQ